MTRTDYLQQLDKYLKKLPKKDYQEAMEYFSEYFDEAGPENEAQVIEELGDPKTAAKEILHNILEETSHQEHKDSKANLKLIWIAILACLLNPFGWALIAILFTLILVGACFLVVFFIVAVMGLISGIIFIGESVSYLSTSWSGSFVGIGLGLIATGLSCLLLLAASEIVRWIGRVSISLARRTWKKGKHA